MTREASSKFKKLSLSELERIYPSKIINDVESFLQHLSLEKGASNNTIIAYRHRILSLLSFLPLYFVAQNGEKEKEVESTKVKDLKSLLGGRKQGKKGLDSFSRLAKVNDQALTKDKLLKQKSSIQDIYLPLPNFNWQDVEVKVIEEFLSVAYHHAESPRTRNLSLSSLRSFYDYLIIMDKVSVNYPKMVSNLKIENKNPKTLDSKAVSKLLDVVAISNYRELRDQTMFEFMVSTGLRVSELANLNVQDFNFDKEDFLVVGKGNVYRTLPLSKNMIKVLALYLILRERELYEKLDPFLRKELSVKEDCFNVNLESEEEIINYAQKIVSNAKNYVNRMGKKSSSPQHKTLLIEPNKASSSQSLKKTQDSKEVISLAALLAKKDSLATKKQALTRAAESSAVEKNLITEFSDNYHSSSELEDSLTKPQFFKHLNANSYSLQQKEQSKSDLKKEGSPLHALFLSSHLQRITVRSIQKRLDLRAEAVGLGRKISPHKLRHTFATLFLEKSSNLRAVQELLGHKNLATTQIYTNLDLSHLINIYNKVHPQQKEYFAQQAKKSDLED